MRSRDDQAASRHARALVALDELPRDRPSAASQPCAACGAPVDPLRAPQVLAFDDGWRFMCGTACTREFRRGARHRRVPTPEPQAETSGFLPVPPASALGATRATPDRVLWAGAIAVALSILCGSFADGAGPALAALVFHLAAALAALRASWTVREDVGWIGWLLGPLGVMVASGAAYASVVLGHGGWLGIIGASSSAGAIVARAWFDAEARAPVAAVVQQLAATLPDHVNVPVHDASDPLSVSTERRPIGVIRAGDEIIVRKGGTVAVDGVVRAGEGKVLAYPGASASIVRRAGDTVLAGARVSRGAMRIVATRVGADRALVRLARFGAGGGRAAAPIAHASDVLARWGGHATLALALVVLSIAEAPDASARYSAAAAVLLAAPLLAVRRAAQMSLVAGAASAATRGIVFQTALALETAGRVSAVALSPRGVLTEGRPEIVEVSVLGDGDADVLSALAAAAEDVAGDDPIARALQRHVMTRRIAPVEVRRATLVPGRGVTASTVDGAALVVGSRRMLLDAGIGLAAADAEVARAEQQGRTPVLVALDGRVRAVIGIEDTLRVGARPAVQRIFDLGAEVMLLTGDQRGVVERIAAALDVTHVKGELSPAERGHEVSAMRGAGDVVAAIGVGGTDDALLAAADVGIVLGQAGGAANDRTVALVGDDVRDATDALWIAHAARDRTLRAVRLAGIAFGLIVAAAATGLIVPGIAALLAVAVDAYGVRAGARLLRRIALRLPART